MTVKRDPPGGLRAYEFFAGGGMARLGLEGDFSTLFANDFDPAKARAYVRNFGATAFREGDVHALTAADLPGRADLAWASSPCQDFSLAGRRQGLKGERSSAFYGFWSLMRALGAEGRAPPVLVIENVIGLLTSHGGQDLYAVLGALQGEGYHAGVLEMDAAAFSPQSRPRLFIVAARKVRPDLVSDQPSPALHSPRLLAALGRAPSEIAARHVFWRLPSPPRRNADLIDILEPDDAVRWHDAPRRRRLLALLSDSHRDRLAREQAAAGRRVGALYRRTRVENGVKVQRAEIRFDGLAGCLRTPGGGSSKQFLAVIEGGEVRTRDLSPRECARLMGLPETYILPKGTGEALRLCGDGVSAPVVRHLSENLLAPLAFLAGEA